MDHRGSRSRSLASEPLAAEGSARALSHFTDRNSHIRRFAQLLHIPEGRVLFFYADGGTGKSLLLDFLEARCCKWLPDWDYLQSKYQDDSEFVDEFVAAEGQLKIAVASVDLAARFDGFDPRLDLHGMLFLRERLIKSGIRFPRFEYALAEVTERTALRGPSAPGFGEHGIAATLAVGSAILGGSTAAAAVGAVPPIFSWLKKHGESFANRTLLKSRVPAETRDAVETQDASILRSRLPEFFRADIHAALKEDATLKRVVFFFDTHEGFWANDLELSETRYFERDQWLRMLLRELLEEPAVLCVVAGRDRPRWATAPRLRGFDRRPTSIDEGRIELRLIDGMEPSDANAYLDSVEREFLTRQDSQEQQPRVLFGPKFREVLLRICAEDETRIHPFYLALCVDAIIAAREGGHEIALGELEQQLDDQGSRSDLVERLLKYVPEARRYAIRALSAARSFDYTVYRHLGISLDFSPYRPDFDLLCHFSFVRGAGDSYHLHDILRRHFALSPDREDREFLMKAHRCLKEFYRSAVETSHQDDAVTSYVYHTWIIDASAGAQEWCRLFDAAAEKGNSGLCETLVTLLYELGHPASSLDEFSIDLRVGRSYFQSDKFVLAAEFFDKSLGILETWKEDPALAEKATRYLLGPAVQDEHFKTFLTTPLGGLQYVALKQSEVLLTKANSLALAGDLDGTDQAFQQAIDLVPSAVGLMQFRGMRTLLLFNRGFTLFLAGDSVRALVSLHAAEADLKTKAAEALEFPLVPAPCYSAMAEVYLNVGWDDAGLSYASHAMNSVYNFANSARRALTVPEMSMAVSTAFTLGSAAFWNEDFYNSAEYLDRARTLSQELLRMAPDNENGIEYLGFSQVFLGLTHHKQGLTNEGRREIESGAAQIADARARQACERDISSAQAECLFSVAEFLAGSGNPSGALDLMNTLTEDLRTAIAADAWDLDLREAFSKAKMIRAFLQARSGGADAITELLDLQREAEELCSRYPKHIPFLAVHASIYIYALRLLPNSVSELLSAVLGPINSIFQQGVYHQRLWCELSDALLEVASLQRDTVSPDAALASYSYIVHLLDQVAKVWPLTPKLQIRKAIAELKTAQILVSTNPEEAAAAAEKCVLTAKAIAGAHTDRADALIAEAHTVLASIHEIDNPPKGEIVT